MRSLTILSLLCICIAFGRIVDARRALFQSSSLGNTFPNYACQTDPSLSPFKLETAYTTSPSANGQRICFTGAPVQRCPPEDPCCSLADFYKLELRVRPTCRRAIRSVTVNGLPAPTPTFEVYGLARDMALFKLPKLNLTSSNVTGAKICITLRDPCPNLAALCPEGDGSCTYAIGQSSTSSSSSLKCCPTNKLGVVPPPPPPTVLSTPPHVIPIGGALPPLPVLQQQQQHRHLLMQQEQQQQQQQHDIQETGAVRTSGGSRRQAPYMGTFPYISTCNQTSGLMPFRLGAPTPSRSSNGGNMYCFSLEASHCVDPSSSCCSSNLLKVDWWSYDTCRGSVKAYVDKVPYPVSWDQGGTFRLTKLNFARDDLAARPKQLCIELRRDGPCDTIGRFCRGGGDGCTYALFDTARSCCPTHTLSSTR